MNQAEAKQAFALFAGDSKQVSLKNIRRCLEQEAPVTSMSDLRRRLLALCGSVRKVHIGVLPSIGRCKGKRLSFHLKWEVYNLRCKLTYLCFGVRLHLKL